MDIRRFRSREYPYAIKHGQRSFEAHAIERNLAPILQEYPALLTEARKQMKSMLAGTAEDLPLADCLTRLVAEMEIADRLPMHESKQISNLSEGFRRWKNPLGAISPLRYKDDPEQPGQGLLF